MRELGEVELSNAMLTFLKLTTSLLTVIAFDWPDATRSHQKVVEKMTKGCQKEIKNFAGWPPVDALDCKLRPKLSNGSSTILKGQSSESYISAFRETTC